MWHLGKLNEWCSLNETRCRGLATKGASNDSLTHLEIDSPFLETRRSFPVACYFICCVAEPLDAAHRDT